MIELPLVELIREMGASLPISLDVFSTITTMALFGKKKKGAEDAAVETAVSDAPAAEPKAEEPKTPAAPKVKVRPDVYTLLLGLSVLALVIATVLLFLNVQAYGPDPISGIPRG